MVDARRADPPLAHRLVGGLQWAVTGSYCFLLGVAVAAWYLRSTRAAASVDLAPAFAALLVGSFLAGYRWVGSRSPDREAHARRIEAVVTLLVSGFAFPFGLARLLGLLGVAAGLPVAGYGAGYALALAVPYGLVYGLGSRFFLGSDPRLLRE
ncbi:hypothetical protein [Halorussus halobius]|uniref:hypothetical protein n=1 Tax=Halorussus halobius TaxID=1710537 RepID=UPI0010933160|nr:hypothetical protein [Halorussus halobius]